MSHLQKSTACNIDLEILEGTLSDIVTQKKTIDKDFRILNELCNSFTLSQIPDNDVETIYLEKGSQSPQKS